MKNKSIVKDVLDEFMIKDESKGIIYITSLTGLQEKLTQKICEAHDKRKAVKKHGKH